MNAYRLLGVLGILFALAAGATAAPVINSAGLIAYYSFDNSAQLANDWSGTGHTAYNGTIVGNVQYSADAMHGGSAYFPNLTAPQQPDYIRLTGALTGSDAPQFKLLDRMLGEDGELVDRKSPDFSAEHAVSPGDDLRAAIRDSDGAQNTYEFGAWDNADVSPQAKIYDNRKLAGNLTEDPLNNKNIWTHLAMTYDRTASNPAYQVCIYVNGNLQVHSQAASAIDIGDWAQGAFIGSGTGGNTSTSGNPFAGWMDEMYLLKRTLTPSEVGVLAGKYLGGDANTDGAVNFTDLNVVLTNYNKSGYWESGDFNGDGMVNFTDLNVVLTNYNQSGGGLSAAEVLAAHGMTLVPEPSSIALLIAAGLSTLVFWWRKRA